MEERKAGRGSTGRGLCVASRYWWLDSPSRYVLNSVPMVLVIRHAYAPLLNSQALLMRSGRTGSEATPLLDCAREGRPDRARGRLLFHPPRSDTAKPMKGGRETDRRRRAKKKRKVFSCDADEASEEARRGTPEHGWGARRHGSGVGAQPEGEKKKEGGPTDGCHR
jgi:hypothetical protein